VKGGVSVDPIKAEPFIKVQGITKRFGELIVNDQINLDIFSGEVHAILGENGAGKSTLMKMLYGVYTPDGGHFVCEGKQVSLHPPQAARAKGIRMVFQDFRLIPALTVLENVALAVSRSGLLYNGKKLRSQIQEVSEAYNLTIDPSAFVWQLDLGERQRVEIVKTLLVPDTRLIIFDEPTSVLAPVEVERFLRMVDLLRQSGYAILLITHKINEVLACADRVSVLRSGKLVFTADKKEGFTAEGLVRSMMGGNQPLAVVKPDISKQLQALAPILTVSQLTLQDDHAQDILGNVSFTMKKGEIVGIAGISGNGQKEIAEALFGLRKVKEGIICVQKKELQDAEVEDFIRAGVAYVPEDPLAESVIAGFTILEHMVLAGLPMHRKGAGIDWPLVEQELRGREESRKLGLAASNRRADRLSGGNVQRMVLTRSLLSDPQVLVVSYPSRGLDIGTTRSIQQMLVELARGGAAVLLISEDLSELFSVSDRLYVLAGRTMQGPYLPEETDIYQIGNLMLKGVGT
jgi:ABC-type uncharacterized transport system ATPase subunit